MPIYKGEAVDATYFSKASGTVSFSILKIKLIRYKQDKWIVENWLDSLERLY